MGKITNFLLRQAGIHESFIEQVDQAKQTQQHTDKQLEAIEKILLGHKEDLTKLKYSECWDTYIWLNNFLVKHDVPKPTSGAMCTIKLDSTRMWSLHETIKWLFERAPKREKIYLDTVAKLENSDKRVKSAHVRLQDAEDAGAQDTKAARQQYADKLHMALRRATEAEDEVISLSNKLKTRNTEIGTLKSQVKKLKKGG